MMPATAVNSTPSTTSISQPFPPDSTSAPVMPPVGRIGNHTVQLTPTDHTIAMRHKAALDEKALRKQQIKQLTNQYQVTISRSNNPNYPWKVTGETLEQAFRFKSLDEMKQSLEGGYLRRTAKHMAAVERLGRGRDVHNVTSLTKMDTGPVLVIDGGDDLAVSLENSGLPRSLVLAVQSTALYPAFIGVVHKGWQGASDEYGEAREEYQELIQSQQALKKEIRELVTKELVLKEQLLNSSDNSNDQQQLRDVLFKHSQFKTALLASVEPLLKASPHDDEQTQATTSQLKDTIKQINGLKSQLAEHNQQINEQLADTQPSGELQQLLDKLSSNQLFDPTSPECHDLIQKLAEYKANQDDKLAKFADTHIAAAFTESGLSGMYWGMVSFEARATSELLLGETAQSFSGILSQMGDTFNVIGQAQMVIAGLTKAGLGITEIKSLNEWLDQINTTPALKNPDTPELAKVKNMVDQFYRHQRNVTAAETVGNSVLTLGQLGMILGGPFGTGIGGILYAGVGATIGGVAMSQAAAQYSNKVFNVSEEKSTKEQAISESRGNDPQASALTIIQQRISDLYKLSQEQAIPKVWLNIYQALINNPKADAFEILAETGKKYQQYDAEHTGHYRQLYREALDNIKNDHQNTIDVINHAKALLQQDINGANAKTALSAFVSQHISALQEGDKVAAATQETTTADQINQLFQFAEQQGFDKEFERRIVKRLINQNGYIGHKENEVDPSPYITQIAANKSKRPWQIPNPIAPIINLGRLVKQLIKPVAHPTLLSNTLSIPMNWGKKDTTIYVFNREKFLQDLDVLTPDSAEGKKLHLLCQTLFTEQMANEAKTWLGKDNRHVFEETMRHIGKKVLRDNVLRPIVHDVSDQVKLADLISQLEQGKTI
ncbi:AAA family ATPase [Spartinivicinus ruber]|uniref:hypothetical protein n=1 Tax=Spartinivicinus ruber TaxID=2683272 RepID=UPI0013CFE330|nr:hypothetical protein [Spartinivicinus ruber]